jgi:protein TonB
MLLAAPVTHLPWQGIAPMPDAAPMTVRLAPAPVGEPDIPATPSPEVQRPPLPEKGGQTRFSASGRQQGQKVESDPIFPDPKYYPARELDDYPRPLAPLRIDRPAYAGAGEVRLELLIDERGVVRDVVFAGPAPSGGAEDELRATLAATPFLPARKDGRPVRSRVLLSLNPGAEERKP